jgi:hypothetical protein
VVVPCSINNNWIKNRKFVTYLEEFSSVLINIINSNRSTADTDIKTDSEVGWLEWHLGSVLLDDHLSIEESALWCSRVDLLWFSDQN